MLNQLVKISIVLVGLALSQNTLAQIKLDKLKGKIKGKEKVVTEKIKEKEEKTTSNEEAATVKNIPIDENIITSDFHRKNVGKILFSKTPITIKKENPTQFTKNFVATDKIYAVVYLPQSIGKLTNKEASAAGKYTYLVDNKQDNDGESGTIEFTHNDEDLDKGFYLIEIIPDVDKAYHGLDPVEWAEALGKMSKRKHTIEIGFATGYDDPFALGTLELDWTNADVAKLKENAQKASSSAQDNYARNVATLPAWFATEQNYVFKDPQLSQANMKAMLKRAWAKKGNIEIVKIIVASSTFDGDWTVEKDSYGLPKSKSTWGNIGVVYKAPDGWCYYTTKVHFYRTYTGGGTYGEAKFLDSGAHHKIDCSRTK